MWRRTKSKFGNKRVTVAGQSYASKLEQAVHQLLLLREKAGEIKVKQVQRVVRITDAEISYRADFECEDLKTGETFYVEAKGVDGERWRMIKKLWKYYGTAKLEVWKGSWAKPYLDEVIIPREGKK